MKKLIVPLVIVIAVSIILAGRVQAGSPKEGPPSVEPSAAPSDEVMVDKWVIPNLTYLTGAWAYYAQEQVWGAKEAQDYINNELGGIRGVPVEIVHYDTGSADMAKVLTEASKIVGTKPLIVLGPNSVEEMAVATSLLAKEGVYSTNISGAWACAKFKPWTLSQVTMEEAQCSETTNAWYKEMKAKGNPMNTVVQFRSPDIPIWTNYARLHRETLEELGVEVIDIDVPIGMVNHGTVAVRALGHKPDATILACMPESISQILIELHRRGWTDNTKNLLFHSAVSAALFETGKGYLDGNRCWLFFDTLSGNPLWRNLLAGYKAEYGVEGSYCMWGYFDAVYQIYQCFEDLKITGDPKKRAEERRAIKDWMNNPPNNTVDTCFGPTKIVNGMRVDTNYLFTIREDPELGGILTDSYPCPQTYWETHPYPGLEPSD